MGVKADPQRGRGAGGGVAVSWGFYSATGNGNRQWQRQLLITTAMGRAFNAMPFCTCRA